MTEDEGVVDRIVHSIVNYPLPIHGVFVSDNFFVAVARVAEVLGLPAPPVSAFETSVDKYRSRLLQNVPGQTARVTSVKELETLLASTGRGPASFTPNFPMIVKPTKGWSSECVSKVNSLEDLATAVQKATSRHGSAAVIEPFFEGPEIDVNFILVDGEILFSEIADEPPCDGDSKDATVHATFSPEALTLPSALPADEQAIAKSTLRDILVNMGFRTGVFHVEARMVNSTSEYQKVDEGVTDLVVKDQWNHHGSRTGLGSRAECNLVEINARPLGFRVTVPSRHISAGAQYWSRLVYVPAPAAGTVRWSSKLSPCEELKRRRPDLAEHVVLGVDYCVPGDKIDLYTDGARTYVAHLLVSSRESRHHAIKLEQEVLKAFSIEILREVKRCEATPEASEDGEGNS
ncbi:ATP-grasp domain-containing protein [Podospora fimiseda]|uniref:ATP-grasp domain-containing protein n=1 Tax=Podospora fimiseda TaxID=252190 RepID=A0AAN7BL76_9PEZI|nr:ATP-grasp domain-containing protein [Podospora fimiseda]